MDIDISDFQVYIIGDKKQRPLNESSVKMLAWFAHYADRVIVKFKSSAELVTKPNGLGLRNDFYEIPLTKLNLPDLKKSITEKDAQKQNIIATIENWAKENGVKFHKYRKEATVEYLCSVRVTKDEESYGVAVGRWNEKFVTGKWDNTDEPFVKNTFDNLDQVVNYLDKWINSNEIKNIKKEVTSMCNAYVHKNIKVFASSKEDALRVIAFNADRIDDTTKALYETMNEGSFQYNYRTSDDKNFMDFINNTLWDEIQDTIKSSKALIKRCIEKRSSSESIVWDALFMIFSFVKKQQSLKAVISSEKMKNWFAFNNVDYKTALKQIIENMKDFRDELRESEKVTAESVDTNKIIYDLKKFAGSSLVAYFKDDTMNDFMPLNKNLTVCKDFAQEYEDNSKILTPFKKFLLSYPTKATIQLRSAKTGKVVYEIDSDSRRWKKFLKNVDKKKVPSNIGKEQSDVEKKLKQYSTKFELDKNEIKDIIALVPKNKDIKKLTSAIIELFMKNSGYKDKKELFKDCECDERAFIGFATFLSKNIKELSEDKTNSVTSDAKEDVKKLIDRVVNNLLDIAKEFGSKDTRQNIISRGFVNIDKNYYVIPQGGLGGDSFAVKDRNKKYANWLFFGNKTQVIDWLKKHIK